MVILALMQYYSLVLADQASWQKEVKIMKIPTRRFRLFSQSILNTIFTIGAGSVAGALPA